MSCLCRLTMERMYKGINLGSLNDGSPQKKVIIFDKATANLFSELDSPSANAEFSNEDLEHIAERLVTHPFSAINPQKNPVGGDILVYSSKTDSTQPDSKHP